MFAARVTVVVALLGAGFVPSAVASATSAEDAVAELADEAVDMVRQEQQLLEQADVDAVRLAEVDLRGNEIMVELILQGVDLTDASRAVLELLPTPAATDAGFIQPPPPVVYEAAIADLARIASAPGAAVPDNHDNRGSLGLLAVAAAALLALGLAALSNALRRKGDELEAMAWTDQLTGIASRRKLDHDLAQPRQGDGQTAVMMVDIDGFERIRDQFGPGVGDDVLRRLSLVVAGQVREGDVVYRYGDAELCVLLPGASSAEAAAVADRVVAAARTIELPDRRPVTIAVGVADGSPSEIVVTLEHADRALQLQHV
jgi:diguanylate cyclase (GGDEF)-like protein